jgi:hypothetical protein
MPPGILATVPWYAIFLGTLFADENMRVSCTWQNKVLSA